MHNQIKQMVINITKQIITLFLRLGLIVPLFKKILNKYLSKLEMHRQGWHNII